MLQDKRSDQVMVKIRRLSHGADLPLPSHATDKSAGADLMAAINKPLEIQPGARALVPTGISIAIPPGFEAQIRPRSGLAIKYGITILNSPGTIDSDYRGEVAVILINHGPEIFRVKRGMRIGQLVLSPVLQFKWVETKSLDQTIRGSGGFGSTGMNGDETNFQT